MSEKGSYIKLEELYHIGDLTDITEWLNAVLGRQNWQLHGPLSEHPNTLYINTQEDAVAFLLKFDLKISR